MQNLSRFILLEFYNLLQLSIPHLSGSSPFVDVALALFSFTVFGGGWFETKFTILIILKATIQ